jgi:succinate dehydrogenase / fumarate reductase, cytochrome b subunit
MSTAATVSPRSAQSTSGYTRARLGSLLAVAPLGVWTVGHLWNNLAAFQGDEAWTHAVTEYPHPLAQLATAIIVLLPLVLHAVWGVSRLFTMRLNNVRYGYWANLKYLLQRLSALGLLAFLGAHLWLAMLKPRLQEGHPESFADISHEMHFHTPTLLVYVLGTLGLAYHLANGLHSFAMGWGIVTSKRALRQTEWVVVGAFFVFLAMAWGAIYALYSAAM